MAPITKPRSLVRGRMGPCPTSVLGVWSHSPRLPPSKAWLSFQANKQGDIPRYRSITDKSYTLNNGVTIPAIAYGCWGGTTTEGREALERNFGAVLKEGFRHVDTAWFYRTEKRLGEEIRKSGIRREELFVTTKLPAHHCGRVREFFEDSLNALGLDYIDLYLIHTPVAWADYEVGENPWPVHWAEGGYHLSDVTFNETWTKMEELLETGKVRAIGVSNFSIKTLNQLLETAKVVPAVNQVEMHPYLAQENLLDFCREKGIHVAAYSPTGRTLVHGDPMIEELAVKYNVTPTQGILGWGIARGVGLMVQSWSEAHHKENLNLPEIEPKDVKKITALDRKQLAGLSLDKHGTMIGWTLERLRWEHLKPVERRGPQ